MSGLEKIVLIVAGGSGSRMGTRVPKQFLLLKGLPVVMHTMERFYSYDRNMRIILILPEDQVSAWKKMCSEFEFAVEHEIAIGGETRFHSVKKNLGGIPDGCLVAVHDGVRPLVAMETIDRCFAKAAMAGNAIPCIDIPETLRQVDKNGSRQVDRSRYRLIQTPQVFESSLLKKCYEQEYCCDFTDDAGVVESMGFVIELVEGNPENIKITRVMDLKLASAMMDTFTMD